MSSVARLRAGSWEHQRASRAGVRPRTRPWSAQKIHFAFEIFVVQIVIVCMLQTVLQLHITHELARTASIETAELLRGIFFDTLRTLTWVGPLITLLSVLVAMRFTDRYTSSAQRVRTAMRQLADGDPGVRLRLGSGDALEGLDEDFNRLAELLAQKRRDRGDAKSSD
jgi:methyl-accepting chemotaxis protein